MPITLPITRPFPIRKVANHRKRCLIVLLRAPRAFIMPIIVVRSRMMMSSPEIIVTPATAVISASMIHTFMSSRSSHLNICGLISFMVCDV